MRQYTPQEIAEINSRYPGMEWVNGQPFTRVQVPSTEIAGYDAAGQPIDYTGAPVQLEQKLVPAETTEGGLPLWFLGAQLAGPAVASGIGALAGGGAGGGAASTAASAGPASFGGLPLAPASTLPGAMLSPSALSAPALAAGGGGMGSFLNSGLGQTLVSSGLGALTNALTPEPQQPVQPFQFSEVEGERGRLVSPENNLYNLTRTLMGLQLGLSRALEEGYTAPPMPGKLSSVNVPGLPFQLGGVGQDSNAFPTKTTPGLNFSTPDERNHLTGLLEDLLRPQVAPEVAPVPARPGGNTARSSSPLTPVSTRPARRRVR